MHLLPLLPLLHHSCYPLQYRVSPSSSFSIKKSIFLPGLRVVNYEVWGFKKKGRRKGGGSENGASERDSEFEVDPEKAREALKNLDEQLQSLSKKQVNPPKIRAVDMKQGIDPRLTITQSVMKESDVEISGSFLASVAGGLLLFTIFYNILFLTVIKPSIDGGGSPSAADDPTPFSDVIRETQGDAIQELSTITDIPLSP